MSALLPPSAHPFSCEISELPAAVAAEMRGVSWREDPRCPPWTGLAYLRVSHLDFFGAHATGELVVARDIAGATRALLARLYELGFPLRRMQRIEAYGGSDDASMAADNSSGFNFRTVTGTDRLSQHALGYAIDLNPRENPWLASGVQPADGAEYLDRTHLRPGMIVRPGPVTAALDELGWEWGGDWRVPDYHHLVKRR